MSGRDRTLEKIDAVSKYEMCERIGYRYLTDVMGGLDFPPEPTHALPPLEVFNIIQERFESRHLRIIWQNYVLSVPPEKAVEEIKASGVKKDV